MERDLVVLFFEALGKPLPTGKYLDYDLRCAAQVIAKFGPLAPEKVRLVLKHLPKMRLRNPVVKGLGILVRPQLEWIYKAAEELEASERAAGVAQDEAMKEALYWDKWSRGD